MSEIREGAGITHKQLNNLIGGYTCRPTHVRTWQHPHHVQISCQCSSRCGGFTSINSTRCSPDLVECEGEICHARVDTPFHQNCFTKIVVVSSCVCLLACLSPGRSVGYLATACAKPRAPCERNSGCWTQGPRAFVQPALACACPNLCSCLRIELSFRTGTAGRSLTGLASLSLSHNNNNNTNNRNTCAGASMQSPSWEVAAPASEGMQCGELSRFVKLPTADYPLNDDDDNDDGVNVSNSSPSQDDLSSVRL
jgi:hypothetical protein